MKRTYGCQAIFDAIALLLDRDALTVKASTENREKNGPENDQKRRER
jgi:hypothetical protein